MSNIRERGVYLSHICPWRDLELFPSSQREPVVLLDGSRLGWLNEVFERMPIARQETMQYSAQEWTDSDV